MSKLTIFLLLLVSVLIGASQLLFKLGAIKMNSNTSSMLMILFTPEVIGGFIFYFLSFVIYMYILKSVPLSVAFPSISLGYVLVVIMSYYIFNESLSVWQGLGVALIVCGVSMLWLGQNSKAAI